MYNANGLPKDMLPARSRPRSGELFSSWLVRLAMAHGLKLHTFCTLLFGKQPIWNRDIDRCVDDRMLMELARRTGTPPERVRATTLAAYEGVLYERHNPKRNTFWIMPLGVYHRVRRMHGTQYCPRCLAEDKEPYFRRAWRLAFVTVCIKHQCLLFDSCPRCDSVINFHRDEMGERSKQVATGMARCFICKFDLRAVCSLAPCDPSGDSIRYQSKLVQAIEDGWIDISGGQAAYTLLYFPVLRQLMKVLASRRATRLFAALCRETGTSPLALQLPPGRSDIEALRISQRHLLKALASHLLEDWPERFVGACTVERVWSSTLLRDFEPAPFWYWSVVHEHLYRASYDTSDDEIRSVIAYINKKGGVAYSRAISTYLGSGDVFRKRDYAPSFCVTPSVVGRASVKVITQNRE
jgi:hypothetical protein